MEYLFGSILKKPEQKNQFGFYFLPKMKCFGHVLFQFGTLGKEATLAKSNSTEMKLNSSVISDEEIKILGRFDLM